MRILTTSNRAAIDRLVARDAARSATVAREAAHIVADVRRRGDRGLIAWERRFGANPDVNRLAPVPRRQLDAGWRATPPAVRRAIRLAARHIARVAARQVPRPFTEMVAPGLRIEQRVEPLARVGCYVPGGRYPLPSTLLMTAIPAREAGVRDIAVACPRPAPAVLAAALEAGIDELWTIGGPQAIAAFAYGTQSIRRVDKIAGPGSAWVAAAKALVSADCAIDLHAGPSEIVVCSDRMPAAWIAADLIAQAEHDPAARALFVTTRRGLAAQVAREIDAAMPIAGPARASLDANGAIIVARSRADAIAIVNRIAPEHLVCDSARDAREFTAGTIFVGRWSAQAAGDYVTGSNHVLPTGGASRFRGGLSAADFVRVFSVQTVSRAAIRAIGPAAVALAEAEGLDAHARSVRKRL